MDRNGNPVKIGMNPGTAREEFRVHELDREGNFSARGRDKGAGYAPFHAIQTHL